MRSPLWSTRYISMASSRARLSVLLGERRKTIVVLAICSVACGFTEAGILALLAQIGTSVATGAKRVHLGLGPVHGSITIGGLLAIALVLAIVRLLLQAPISILPARIGGDVQASLREGLFDAHSRASWTVQSGDREGYVQELMTSQVLQATAGANQATTLLTASIMFLILLISAFALNVLAAAVVTFTALALFGLLRPLNRLGSRRARALSQAQMEYAGGVGEAIRMSRETRVFGVGDAQRSRIDGLVAAARELFYRTWLLARLVPNLYQSTIYIVLVAGLAGIYAIGPSHLASLGAVVLLLVRAGTNGQVVQTAYQGLLQALPFVERLQDSQRRYATSAPLSGERELTRVQTLSFEHVSFAYRHGESVLSDITFQVFGGEAIGIVGPSGAGKSTLVELLLRLRPPDRGRYLVNELLAEEYADVDWHRSIAYVPQEPLLAHASVAENIRYYRDLDQEAIERAARLARIHEDIIAWPGGYETIVGPRADAVSGGQRQRICLARALAARPGVLVLDEPTSALDPHSENLIQESLSALKHELTMFIVAHRMSTLEMCDQVMVILGGRLAAFDSREVLERENPYYRRATVLASRGGPKRETSAWDQAQTSAGRAARSG